MSEGKKEEPRQVPGAIYANQIVGSFGSGVAAPFVSSYAKRLNATGVELGWLQSIQNLFPNVLQIPWSRLSDRLGRKTPFIIVGTALAAEADAPRRPGRKDLARSILLGAHNHLRSRREFHAHARIQARG